jgi:starvation-inducible DNA-binding protein
MPGVAQPRAELMTPTDPATSATKSISPALKEMRRVHAVCDEHGDIATASLIENWIDETERRTWFLFEFSQSRSNSNR